MDIKKAKINGYEVECPICKKKLNSMSWKQLNYNYKLHHEKCNKKPVVGFKTSDNTNYKGDDY